MALWASNPNMSIRCWLDIFNGDDYVGMVYVTVPALLGGMYVPGSVMAQARQKGDRFDLGLHIRTNDNSNRYYTNAIKLSDLKSQRASKKVVIPLL